LADASGRDLDAWARAWLQTAGVATLTADPDAESDAGPVVLARDDRRPHRFGVGRYVFDGVFDGVSDGAAGLVRAQHYDVEIAVDAGQVAIDCPSAPLIL